jgi:hypothetical protein
MTRDARDLCANGVEATMASLLLFIYFSFLSYKFVHCNFVDQTLEAHVFVNFGIYLPLKPIQKFQVFHSFSFCTI